MRSFSLFAGALACGVTCALAGAPTAAWAADITVGSTADNGQGCTLRDAVRTAQNAPSYAGIGGCTPGSAGVDRIVVAPGTYGLSAGGAGEDRAAGGDIDILESVIIEGSDRTRTFVDGGGRDRVFHVIGRGVRAEMSHITVQNGNANGEDGGGIYVMEGAHLVLEDVVVARNVSNVGGGGIDSFGDLTLTRSTIENNRTQNDGGLRCLASCTGRLTQVIIRNNTATGPVGGGLGAAGNLFLDRVQVLDNRHTGSLGAGGLSCLQFAGGNNTIMVVNSLIANNSTGGDGGGVRVSTIAGYFDGAPQVSIINTTITGNRATRGAGVSIGIGRATLSNVTVVDNEASGEGGGILHTNGRLELRNTLVARNRASRGLDCRGNLTSLGYALVGRTGDCAVTGGSGNRLGTNAPIDARVATALADNGGPTRTMALLADSPAVNAGDPAGCGDGAQLLMTDQRGMGFPRSVGGRCDIGAFELDGCGNGAMDPGEGCDDGNTTAGDCCSPSCQPEPVGGFCDDRIAGTTGDRCTAQGTCVGTSPSCGNGTVETALGETCDDMNQDDTDLCNSSCQDTGCGDGVVQAVRGELCDNGAANSDVVPGACRSSCQPPSCDDGVEDPGEMCAMPDAGPITDPPDAGTATTSAPDAGPRPRVTSTPQPVDSGCSCGVGRADVMGGLALLAVAALIGRRRR